METHEIFRGLREDQDLTQQYIADLLKIKRTMYRRYETGETELPVRHLKTLCLFLYIIIYVLLSTNTPLEMVVYF